MNFEYKVLCAVTALQVNSLVVLMLFLFVFITPSLCLSIIFSDNLNESIKAAASIIQYSKEKFKWQNYRDTGEEETQLGCLICALLESEVLVEASVCLDYVSYNTKVASTKCHSFVTKSQLTFLPFFSVSNEWRW